MRVFLKRRPSGPTLSRFTAVLNSVGKIQLAALFLIPLIKEWKPQEFWALLTFHLLHLLSEHKATSESHPENIQISFTFLSSSALLPWGGRGGGSGFTLATVPDFIPIMNLAPFTPNKRVPWPSRKSNQSILKEINPEDSLEGLVLKLQYFGHLMWSRPTGTDPDAGRDWREKEEGGSRRWDGWMASPSQRTWIWANSGRYRKTGKTGVLQSTGSQSVRTNFVTEEQQCQ